MSTGTTLTASYVSRLLGSKHRRSVRTSTRVRGYHHVSRGFSVEDNRGGTVFVRQEWPSSPMERAALTIESEDAALERYAATLREAGLTVEPEAIGSPYARLRVTREATS